MDYAAIKLYIESDTDFDNDVLIGSDVGVAERINSRTVPVVGGVSRAKFAMWAGKTGIRSTIQDHANTQGSPLRAICLTLLDFLQGGVADSLDFSDADNQQMLGIWVAMSEITQTQADELIAMATTQQPVFGQYISHGDVAKALRG